MTVIQSDTMKELRLDGITVKPRDWELLFGLFESRVMTLKHLAALYFDDMGEMAKKRVQKLKAAGFIRERPRRRSDPAIHFLTRQAFLLLREHNHLKEYPQFSINDLDKRVQVSDRTINHELEVLDVKAAVTAAVRKSERYTLAEFSTWPSLYEFEACNGSGKMVPVQPDGFIRIREKESDGGISEHVFFLEVDRSKEVQEILANKAHCYMDYRRGGGFAVNRGGSPTQHKRFPFRALFVLKTADRRNNTAARLLLNNPPIGSQVWLTTLPEVAADPLGSIWICSPDYRVVTRNTPFDPYLDHNRGLYRSRPEREGMVDATIAKRCLFEEI